MITRRQAMWGAAGSVLLAACAKAQPNDQPPPRRALVLPDLPYRRIEVPGVVALAEWQRLRDAGQGWPVVIGGDEAMSQIAEQLAYPERRPAADILRAAARLSHPSGLARMRAAEWDATPAERREEEAAMTGTWPRQPEAIPTLDVAIEPRSRQPYARVHILVIPTRSGWEVPAYLGWGGSNECPNPEYHVAALRSWQERHGAELIGLGGEVMNLRVRTRPATRAAALALAREQYLYCPDITEQGLDSYAALAAALMASDWWYFWWD